MDISDFRPRVLSQVPGCPGFIADRAVVDAIIQFCSDTWIMKKGFEVAVLSTDVDTTLNDSVDIDISAVASTTLKPLAIDRFQIDGANYTVKKRELSTDITYLDEIGIGSVKFFDFTSDTVIRMWPFEEEAMTFFLNVVFKPLSTITTIDDFIYDNHIEPIVSMAQATLQEMAKKPWTNSAGARGNRVDYAEGMGKARIKINQEYVGNDTRVDYSKAYFA